MPFLHGIREIFGQNLRAVFLEARCAVCMEPVEASAYAHRWFRFSAGANLCPDCAKALTRKESGFCAYCGEFFADAAQSGVCSACMSMPRPWGKVYFHAAYSGLLRELVHRLKFGGALHLAPALGALLAARPNICDTGYDCIIPVPLHKSRLTERGFNQAAELARPLAAALKAPVDLHSLKRGRATRSQTGLTRLERSRNLRGAFTCKRLHKERVLLLDDVMTTGATLHAAALCLLEAGAGSVDAAFIARTPARNMCAKLTVKLP